MEQDLVGALAEEYEALDEGPLPLAVAEFGFGQCAQLARGSDFRSGFRRCASERRVGASLKLLVAEVLPIGEVLVDSGVIFTGDVE